MDGKMLEGNQMETLLMIIGSKRSQINFGFVLVHVFEIEEVCWLQAMWITHEKSMKKERREFALNY